MLMMFYSTIVTCVIAYESINRCQHRTVYTHVIAKFIKIHVAQCEMQWSCRIAEVVQCGLGFISFGRNDTTGTFFQWGYVAKFGLFFTHLSHDLRRSIMVHFHPFWSWKAQLPINHLHGNEPPSLKFLNLNSKRERKSNDLEQLEVE